MDTGQHRWRWANIYQTLYQRCQLVPCGYTIANRKHCPVLNGCWPETATWTSVEPALAWRVVFARHSVVGDLTLIGVHLVGVSLTWPFYQRLNWIIKIHILDKRKRNATPLYGYSVQNISYPSRNWNTSLITWLLKIGICQFFWRGSPTVVRMTHFCMLRCQKEWTHAFLHWLMSLNFGRLASMRNVLCLRKNTRFPTAQGSSVHYLFVYFLLWPIRGHLIS